MENLRDLNLQKLLHGEYEYTDFTSEELRDRRVPDFSYNILNKRQLLYSPVVDRRHLSNGGDRPDWPDDADFAVCLTHDMDHVSKHSPKQSFRDGMLRARRRWASEEESGKGYLDETGKVSAMKSVAGAVIGAVSSGLKRGEDPYHRCEDWLEIEERYDAKSTFFVLPEEIGRSHISDPEYCHGDEVVFDGERCTVAEMVREIDERGWEIGLHPTWYAYDDQDLLRRQKEEIEKITQGDVESVRQHYLHYDPRRTPCAHHQAGFSYDSTVGFNRNVGFRRGCSYPWRTYDLEDEESLDVLEIPMIVQDVALFRDGGLDLEEEQAIEYTMFLAEKVSETGGVLTLSWHASAIADDGRRNVYENILEGLSERGAWFGSVKDIGKWWNRRGTDVSLQ